MPWSDAESGAIFARLHRVGEVETASFVRAGDAVRFLEDEELEEMIPFFLASCRSSSFARGLAEVDESSTVGARRGPCPSSPAVAAKLSEEDTRGEGLWCFKAKEAAWRSVESKSFS